MIDKSDVELLGEVPHDLRCLSECLRRATGTFPMFECDMVNWAYLLDQLDKAKKYLERATENARKGRNERDILDARKPRNEETQADQPKQLNGRRNDRG